MSEERRVNISTLTRLPSQCIEGRDLFALRTFLLGFPFENSATPSCLPTCAISQSDVLEYERKRLSVSLASNGDWTTRGCWTIISFRRVVLKEHFSGSVPVSVEGILAWRLGLRSIPNSRPLQSALFTRFHFPWIPCECGQK